MKKIYFLTFMLSIFILALSPLHINATTISETTEDSNAELIEEEGDVSVTSSGEGYGKPDDYGEYWYILSTDSPTFGNQEVDIDYNEMSELLKYLKPGDIIYETNDSIIGDVTGHIAIVYDILWDEDHQQYYVSIIEAYTGGVGYSIMTPNRFDAKEVIIYRLKDASETQIQGALNWLEEKCGDNFRFHTRKYLNGLQEDGETYWYCAELIWAAFVRQGIGLDWDDNNDGGSLISPHALVLYENLTTILHYNEETVVISIDDVYHTYSCDGDTYTEAHDYEVYNYCYEKCRACEHVRLAIEHDYTNSYVFQNDLYHHSYCVCGSSRTNLHNFECDGVENGVHYEKCVDCGYRVNQFTIFEYSNITSMYHDNICSDCGYVETHRHNLEYEKIDSSNHKQYCVDCGYIKKTEAHSYTYSYTPTFRNRHMKNCVCGDHVFEACIGMASVGGDSYCLTCGQKLGIIIGPLNVDDEEEILPLIKKEEEYYE